MRKYRKCKTKHWKGNQRHISFRKHRSNKTLRSGSKAVKAKLLEINPHCDICGSTNNLQLHHIKMIRWGYPTKIEWSVLLCPRCHHMYHSWDFLLDKVHYNKTIDDLTMYQEVKKKILQQLNIN